MFLQEGNPLDNNYTDSKLIEMIVKEKMKKQRLVVDLESVDDKDLLELIEELKNDNPGHIYDENEI